MSLDQPGHKTMLLDWVTKLPSKSSATMHFDMPTLRGDVLAAEQLTLDSLRLFRSAVTTTVNNQKSVVIRAVPL